MNQYDCEPENEPSIELFRSIRKFKQADLTQRLSEISWLQNIGSQPELECSFSCQFETTWKQAARSLIAVERSNTFLEAQNQLTTWLHQYHQEEYSNWNQHVDEHWKDVLYTIIWPKLKKLAHPALGPKQIQRICLDILGALMENTYLHLGHQFTFHLELLDIYSAGLIPCGWSGIWPDGDLVVF